MSDSKDPKNSAYEVGYGKPPKEHQFKPKARSVNGGVVKKRKGRKCTADDPKKVDLGPLLFEPVPVNKHGRVQKMDAFEAMLRKQVEQAVKHRSATAIKVILAGAVEYDLLETPPPIRSGGVLRVPMNTHEEFENWVEEYMNSREVARAKVRK